MCYLYVTLVVLIMMCTKSLQNGWTGLIWASRGGHLDCVKELLEKGALVNALSTVSAV